jgi:hypothetical protein
MTTPVYELIADCGTLRTTLGNLTLTLFQPHNNTTMTLTWTRYPPVGRAPVLLPGAINATDVRALIEPTLTLFQPHRNPTMTLQICGHRMNPD